MHWASSAKKDAMLESSQQPSAGENICNGDNFSKCAFTYRAIMRWPIVLYNYVCVYLFDSVQWYFSCMWSFVYCVWRTLNTLLNANWTAEISKYFEGRPVSWNSRPTNMQMQDKISTFKSHLKTKHLMFPISYWVTDNWPLRLLGACILWGGGGRSTMLRRNIRGGNKIWQIWPVDYQENH